MQIKQIEGNEIKALVYRPWNGIQYGADESERIIKQYSKTPFDRSAGAYIMSKRELMFWEQYFRDLSEDEKLIREANLAYHPADVEDYLRRELDIAGDDPRLHHKARQKALEALKKDFPAWAKQLKAREVTQDMLVNLRFSLRTDMDIIDYLRQQVRYGETRSAVIKRTMRIGIAYEKRIEEKRAETIANMKKEGWI